MSNFAPTGGHPTHELEFVTLGWSRRQKRILTALMLASELATFFVLSGVEGLLLAGLILVLLAVAVVPLIGAGWGAVRGAERLLIARNLRLGRLGHDETLTLLKRYVIPTEMPTDQVVAFESVIRDRYAHDPGYGPVVVSWLRGGHNLVLLLNGLVSRLTPAELHAHLVGEAVLDDETIAVLAGLTGTSRGDVG